LAEYLAGGLPNAFLNVAMKAVKGTHDPHTIRFAMTMRDAARGHSARPLLLVAGVLLIAASLRAPFTVVGPVLGLIRASFDLGTAGAGMLTALPLLTFALVSPFAGLVARKSGLERTLGGALALIAGGIALRSLGPASGLYFGTFAIGTGIALGNVLLPSLLKRDFPDRIAGLTAAYTVTMGGAAALASALIVPLAGATNWPLALASIIVLPAAALACWLPQFARHTPPAPDTAAPPHGGPVWRSPIAWQVTAFMGINSVLYYFLVAWLPAILIDAGYSPTQAGTLHGVMQLAGAAPGLVLGPLVARARDQTRIAVAASVLVGLGFAGLLLAPGWAVLWVASFGAGTGSGIALCLMFMSLRAATPHQAATLSGMAQCVGYLLAASGPPLAGWLHDGFGGWTVPLAGGAMLAVAMAVAGALAGRARQLAVDPA
jgi:MFS transporter, CP family, cyanate transporter